MPTKKKARKRDDAFVDYPTVEDLVTGPDPEPEPEEESLFYGDLPWSPANRFKWFLVLAAAIFVGGLALNIAMMVVDYEVTSYQSEKFLKWQDDQIQQYEHEHPGSHPHTKDFDSDANL